MLCTDHVQAKQQGYLQVSWPQLATVGPPGERFMSTRAHMFVFAASLCEILKAQHWVNVMPLFLKKPHLFSLFK